VTGEAGSRISDVVVLDASALFKQVQRNVLSREEAVELFDDLRRLPLRSVSASELSVHAFSLALDHGLSVYDSAYLALAQSSGAPLITADQQIERAANNCGCTLS